MKLLLAFALGAFLAGLVVRRVWEDRLYFWLGQRRPRYELLGQ